MVRTFQLVNVKEQRGARTESSEHIINDGNYKKGNAVSVETQSASRRRQLKMLHRFSRPVNLAAVLVVLLAFSAVQQVPAAAVDGQRNLAPTATVTILSTSFLPGAATSTLLTQSACGIIDGGGAITACRRKRQYWIDVPILIAQDPETAAYLYQQFQPSPVFA